MSQRFTTALLVLTFLVAAVAPSSAANKEHQQLMADLRMLQEQSQLLQNTLMTLTEALKAVNTRLDQQAEATRKAFADEKLLVDNLTGDTRVIKEKLDDNNVRIGSLTQEVDSLRQALQQLQQSSARPATTTDSDASAGGGGSSAPGGTAPSAPSAPAVSASPTQVWDAAYADYTAGQYDLAVMGFDSYIKSFPKSDKADNAQVYICASYLNDNKNDKAAEACDLVIRNYPGTDAVPEAYYRKGLALANLKDAAGARASWEMLIKTFPDSDAATQAKQRLAGLKK